MIYVLYGQPASGKTTIGKKMAEFLQTPFVIDGDEFRDMFSKTMTGGVVRGGLFKTVSEFDARVNKTTEPQVTEKLDVWRDTYNEKNKLTPKGVDKMNSKEFRDKARQDFLVIGTTMGISSDFYRIDETRDRRGNRKYTKVKRTTKDGFNDPRLDKVADYKGTPDGEKPKHINRN